MFDNQIIPPNEKIKKFRLLLGATQKELAEGVCTKNNISRIESCKQKLTFNSATGLAANLNKIAKYKKIYISTITANELLKSEDIQANEIFKNKIINELKQITDKNIFKEKFLEAEYLISKYDIANNEKMLLYTYAADFYYHEHMYAKSDEMCRKALKVNIYLNNIEEEINIYIYKSRNCITTFKYDEALEHLDSAEILNKDICNDTFSITILFNRSLIYKKLTKYDEALKYLDILKENLKLKNDKIMLLKVKMVYANCLNDQHKFKQSKREYIETLELAMQLDNNDFIALTYKNLSELYFNKKDYKYAATYIKDSLTYNPNNEYLNDTLYFAAKVFQNLNEDVQIYLLQALDICEKSDRENLELIEKIIYELVLIYIKRKDEVNLVLMQKKVDDLNVDCTLIYPIIIGYYIPIDIKKSMQLHEKYIKKIKKIKKI